MIKPEDYRHKQVYKPMNIYAYTETTASPCAVILFSMANYSCYYLVSSTFCKLQMQINAGEYFKSKKISSEHGFNDAANTEVQGSVRRYMFLNSEATDIKRASCGRAH